MITINMPPRFELHSSAVDMIFDALVRLRQTSVHLAACRDVALTLVPHIYFAEDGRRLIGKEDGSGHLGPKSI